MPSPNDDAAVPSTSLPGVLRMARARLHGGWRAERDIEPDYWSNLQRELLAGRQWLDRSRVLAFAAATGTIVVAFTLLAEAAIHGFRQVEGWGDHGRYFALLWTPALTVAVLWWTRRYVPGAGGSGIPQVVRALEADLPPSQSAWLASMRVLLHTVFGNQTICATWISAWSGVPAGVFAPSLAIGAGIGLDVALFMGMSREAAMPLIAMGMAGFLAATTGGPITAFIIVLEMVSGQAMVLSLMACALLSSGVARLVTRPMYQELAAMLCLPPPSEPAKEKP